MVNHSGNNLDKLDITLITELEKNARQTMSELAKKIDTDRHTVNRKLKKLLGNRIIRIVAVPDPLALGFKTIAWIGINAQPDKVDSVAEKIGHLPPVRHIHINAGRYNIHILAVCQGPEELSNFVRDDLTKIKEMTTADSMVILKIIKGSFGLLANEYFPFRDKPPDRKLQLLDLAIIHELMQNPRIANKDIARKLDSSPPTIWRRLKWLLENRIIRVVAITNPKAFGYTMRATIAINVKPDQINVAADKLASYNFIHGVMINTGRFDILAWGDFKGSEDLSNFITRELGQLSGLIRHETMITLKITKDDFMFETV